MPHKRQNQKLLNSKNPIPRRIQVTNSSTLAPKVSVRAESASETPTTSSGRHQRNDENAMPSAGVNKNHPHNQLQSEAPNFAVPRFNTVIRDKKELLQLQSTEMKNNPDWTPRTKAAIMPKITMKMNFPPDRAVFDNLVPLNMNDLNLEPLKSDPPKRSSSKTPTPEEPQLADYLEPIPHLELVVPEPDLCISFTNDFNFFEAYKRLYK